MPLRIQCINCQGIISVAENLRGKAIRCPHCQEPTKVPGAAGGRRPTQLNRDDDFPLQRDTRFQGPPRRKTALAPQYDEPLDYDEPVEDGHDDYPPRSRQPEYYDDEPRRYAPHREKSGAGIWIVSSLGLLLVLGAVGGAVWYVKYKKDQVAQKNDDDAEAQKKAEKQAVEDKDNRLVAALQLLPADSDYVLGTDATAAGNSLCRSLLNAYKAPVFGIAAKDQRNLLLDTERVLVGGSFKNEKPNLVLVLKKDYEFKVLKKIFKLKTSAPIGGKDIHVTDTDVRVFLPDARTVVILNYGTDEEIAKVVEGSSLTDADLIAQVKKVGDSPAWLVANLGNEDLKMLAAKLPAKLVPGPYGDALGKLVSGGTFLSATLTPADGQTAALELRLECANEEDAGSGEDLKLAKAIGDSDELKLGLRILGAFVGKEITLESNKMKAADSSLSAILELALKDVATGPKQTPTKDLDQKIAMKPVEKPSFKIAPLQTALIPEGPRPDNISPSVLKLAKRSTVFLKVKDRNGIVSEASGFVGAEPGLVFTNAHVVTPGSSVEIILNRGTEDEERITSVEVMGRDRINDLAVLRIVNAKKLPAPLPVELDGCNLAEVQPVYVLGFPSGTGAAQEVSSVDTTVTSLRKDAGLVTQIQVGGGMDAGSSGGPVLDSRGVVVGVCRAGIKGSSINFAIPAEKIRGLLHGRIYETNVGDLFLDDQTPKLPVTVNFLAPRSNVNEVTVDLWVGPPGQPRPASLNPPTALATDGTKQTIRLELKTDLAERDLELPTLPAGQVYWLQPCLVSGNVRQWAQAVPVVSEAPLLPLPANLKLAGTVKERSLKLTSKFEYEEIKGKQKRVESDNIQFQALEQFEMSSFGITVRFILGEGEFSSEKDGLKLQRHPDAQTMVRSMTYLFQGNGLGQLTKFVAPAFSNPSIEAKLEAENMAGNLSSSYQALSLAVPGKEVNRGDGWISNTTLLLDSGKKKMTLELNCKYQGRRMIDGKPQALIRMTGELKPSSLETVAAGQPTDIVTGYALFDLEGSFFSKVHLKVRPEVENESLTQKRFEATLERSPGNTFSITPPVVVAKNPKGDDPMVDLAKLTDTDLNGLWVLEQAEASPGKFYVYGFEEAIKIDGFKVTWVKKSGEFLATYPPAQILLDTSRNPKCITFTSDGPLKKWLGIYKIENDKLYIATNLDKSNRPKLFITQQAVDGAALHARVYKRAQPGEFGPKPADPPPQNPPPQNPPPDQKSPSQPPVNQPPQQPVKQPVDPVLAGLLADLKSGNAQKAKAAAQKLTKIQPTQDGTRKDIIQALTPLLTNADAGLHNASFHAFGIWAGADGLSTLAGLVNNGQVSNVAMDTLARVGGAQTAQVIAGKLSDPAHKAHAAGVLKSMGSAAEYAVVPLLQNAQLRTEVCHILKQIGTATSVQYLSAYPKDNAAKDAANTIRSRNGAPQPGTLQPFTVGRLTPLDRKDERTVVSRSAWRRLEAGQLS